MQKHAYINHPPGGVAPGERREDMKQMNKRNSERVLAYIKKARNIIDQEPESREDELFLSDVSIAEDCLSALSEIMVTINNTTM